MYRHNAKVIDLFQAHEKPTTQPSPEIEAAFSEFWKWYPKKIGKPLVKAKFVEIVTKGLKTRTLDRDSGNFVEIELTATAQEIVDGVKRYVDSLVDKNTFKRKVEDKYLPHPATWINQGRWMDE